MINSIHLTFFSSKESELKRSIQINLKYFCVGFYVTEHLYVFQYVSSHLPLLTKGRLSPKVLLKLKIKD